MRPIPFSFLDTPLEEDLASDNLSCDFSINLNRELIHSPMSTFLFRVKRGLEEQDNYKTKQNRINNKLIIPDDVIIVDQSLIPKINDIVLVVEDGEFLVRRYIEPKGEEKITEARGVVTALVRVFR